ncbi:protein D2-like [Cydia amplana]|uniref:protein D2-like n=1 Tax=Cydia amplana TaxID=1869771 RepID=UPI002FE65D66
MFRILRCLLICSIAVSMVNIKVFTRAMSTVATSFSAYGIVPDVIPVAPEALATVKYPSLAVVSEGNVLSPSQVQDVPQISWNASADKYYTVAMTDPDVLSRKVPTLGEFRHWLVGNVPGDNVTTGQTLAAYIGAKPLPGTGLHRYVFLVYQQPGKLNFYEPRLRITSAINRVTFSIHKFAVKYGLGTPIAGNFFQAEFSLGLGKTPLLFKWFGR